MSESQPSPIFPGLQELLKDSKNILVGIDWGTGERVAIMNTETKEWHFLPTEERE